MKKLTFLVYHKEYSDFLKKLQDLGLVHVIIKESGDIENSTLKEKYDLISRYSTATKFLEKRKYNKDIDKAPTDEDSSGEDILQNLENIRYDYDLYQQQLTVLKKEHDYLSPWGHFSLEKINKIENEGFHIQFFSTPIKGFKTEWEEQFNAVQITQVGSIVYFVTISNEEVSNIDADEVKKPERSLSDVANEIDKTEVAIQKAENLMDEYAEKYLNKLKNERQKTEQQFNFDRVVLGTEKRAEDNIMLLEGWIPDEEEIESKIISYLEQEGIFYEINRPTPADDVPVKLKNNRFSRLFESIGELYTLPSYQELDLVPFFAPFYMLFFGFCLGDAGYGLLIIIGTLFGIYKGNKKFKPIFKLGMFLGIATTFMGIVGGTFFGIMLAEEKWEWLGEYNRLILDNDRMMLLALGLGYVQVLLGMFIKAFNRIRMYGGKYAISQFGWIIIVMIFIPTLLLSTQDLIPKDKAKITMIVSAIVGGIPALFYNSPGKNPFLNFGVGLWDTYQTASGLLGDVLSYIRLFALGISSAILGNVFNTLAADLSPSKPLVLKILVMILILAFGHGLNFFMAALGSFVHPLRLTFVEFYKNAGFSGGGNKYAPFKN